jgi:hypothetical protein
MKRLVARSVSTFRTFQPRMLDFVLVRHGESEGNTAYDRSRAGDHSLYSGDFLTRHSSQWRLTERGRWQAKKAGAWIMKNMDCNFHRYYTSEYSRAYFLWDYPIYGSAAACAVTGTFVRWKLPRYSACRMRVGSLRSVPVHSARYKCPALGGDRGCASSDGPVLSGSVARA